MGVSVGIVSVMLINMGGFSLKVGNHVSWVWTLYSVREEKVMEC